MVALPDDLTDLEEPMARRARQSRKTIPGHDEFRPSREDRIRDHRRVRHAANQMLRTVSDADDLALPEIRSDHPHIVDVDVDVDVDRPPRRFDVGKTKFWKRRAGYREFRASMDSMWRGSGPVEG